jgi:hypothetical protein
VISTTFSHVDAGADLPVASGQDRAHSDPGRLLPQCGTTGLGITELAMGDTLRCEDCSVSELLGPSRIEAVLGTSLSTRLLRFSFPSGPCFRVFLG